MTNMNPETWAKTSHDMVTQTRRWAETMRGITLGSWQGAFANSQVLHETTRPLFDSVVTIHDQALDLWEKTSHAAIDQALHLADNVNPKA